MTLTSFTLKNNEKCAAAAAAVVVHAPRVFRIRDCAISAPVPNDYALRGAARSLARSAAAGIIHLLFLSLSIILQVERG